MKRVSLLLIFVLTFSMFPPMILITMDTASEAAGIGSPEELTILTTTPGTNATVINVSDDTIVGDNNPDTNYDDNPLEVSNWTGTIGRSWLKFNLTHIPDNLHFSRATVNLFTWSGVGTTDYPIGVYFSENDTWTEELLTWNTQPAYNAVPVAIIDSPASPDMFQVGNWYEWDVTTEVIQTIEEDGIMSLVFRFVDEDTFSNSVNTFASRETAIDNEWTIIPFVSLEYSDPTTTELQVDGFSESPQIDYIRSANPDFSWTFSDADQDDFQKNYELEVWNNPDFDDTSMMIDSHSESTVVHDTGGTGTSLAGPFDINDEVRSQFKWTPDKISQSGVVDKLYFEMDVLSGATTYTDLTIYMLCVSDSGYLGADFQSNYDGRTPVQVLNRSEYTAITDNGFMVFDIENTFIIQSNLNLIVEFRHTGYTGLLAQSNYSVGTLCSSVYDAGAGTYSSNTANLLSSRSHGLKLEIVSADVFSGGASTNSIPFGLSIGDSGRCQFKYNQSLIDDEGVIDKIIFPANFTGDVSYENFSVYLVETPHKGELSHTDMDSNYAGMTPTLVLSADEYVLRDVGGSLVIDVDDLFYYTNTNDLMIELRFDSFEGGNQRAMFASGAGGYRAYVTTPYTGNDTVTYNMLLEFIYDANLVEYSGTPLVNATSYFWRVRTCDSIGIWSSWGTGEFKFELIESEPNWSNLAETASPIELGESMTISIDVTHITGIIEVQLEFNDANHTMSTLGNTYSHTWVPNSAGIIPYSIYMESYSGTWSTYSDDFGVVDTTSPTWVVAPNDKILLFGEALNHQFNAADLSGIASWAINDTVNFEITDGLVTNKTILAPGVYNLSVTVIDNADNILSGTFRVAVFSSTSTTSTTTTTTTTTTDTTTDTDTNTTTTVFPIDGNIIMVIAGLVGAIVILIIVIVVQGKRK